METEQKKRSKAYSISSFIMSLYLFLILGVFPLSYKYQYYKMDDFKYQFFRDVSVACVLILFFFFWAVLLWRIERDKWQETKAVLFYKATVLDKAVLFYFFSTTLSFLLSDFKEDCFYGSSGWYMGYLSQILFVAVYFLVSRAWEFQHEYIGLLLAVSAAVFMFGILHRFDLDILGVYGNLALKYKMEFLSTVGQSSWYSSFLCTVFPLGLYLFFAADRVWIRLTTGIFSCLSMLTLVTQNTDSAFLCLAAVLIVIFYLAFDGKKQMWRFLEILILISGSFTFMGICQKVFAEHVVPIDPLSVFASQGWVSPCVFGILLVLYGWCHFKEIGERLEDKAENLDAATEKKEQAGELSRKWFWVFTAVFSTGILLVIVFIILNSTDFLYAYFGYRNVDNYLLFTDEWGNRRGFAWRFTCETYGQQPFLQKLFGVGPDGYYFYNKSVPGLSQQVRDFWGNLALTNAHNEYLTKLYNLGIVGLFSYVFMLGSAVSLFVKKRKEHILLPAFALCAVSYMTHNIFCYEQVCCSPFFYILMGFGSNLIYNNKKKSTY